MRLKFAVANFACAALLQLAAWEAVSAQQLDMSYPGLTGESAPLWIARESGIFKEYSIDARLVYMEGGRLSIQSLLANSTQFMTGDAVSALSAIAGGADIVLLASAKNVLPYVFAVSKDVRRPQELKGRIIATSQIGGRAGEIARMHPFHRSIAACALACLLAAAAPAFAAHAGWRQITVPGLPNAQAPIPVLLYYPTHEQETHMGSYGSPGPHSSSCLTSRTTGA